MKPLSIILGVVMLCMGLLPIQAQPFSRADSLQGNTLSPLRTCYDINYYHLDVKVDIDHKYISGSNLFKFTATRSFDRLQFDLFANLNLEKIIYNGQPLPYKREYNAVFVTFPKAITKGSRDEFTVYYSGKPQIAKLAPWDGGFVFAKDSLGKDWVAVACEDDGASLWWPNKDQRADEVDSMLISVSVPKGLKDVSNGRLRNTIELNNGYTQYNWFVANPINNYDVTLNIANYAHIADVYNGEKGKLTLDYWVLPQNFEKARKQLEANVKPMLKAFEYWFGPYPFYADGYKLVETPYLGMEHQSAIAYGNNYRNGYRGIDLSGTGWGLKWDFIVVHESGHEWFGNSITDKDKADMWIHEGFTHYSESLFIETWYGKRAGQEYINGVRKKIKNDAPIIAAYNVNQLGSGDMYYKGANLLNMIRAIINDDDKWLRILRGLNKTFYHQTVTTTDIVNYINKQAAINLTQVFDQYLRYKNLPELQFKFKNGKTLCRWVADVKGFNMPVRIKIKGGEYQFINPDTDFKPVAIPGLTKKNLEVDTFNYYIKTNL